MSPDHLTAARYRDDRIMDRARWAALRWSVDSLADFLASRDERCES